MARIVVTDSASADQAAILRDLHTKAGSRVALEFRALFAGLFDRLALIPPAVRVARRRVRTSASGLSPHLSSFIGCANLLMP